MRLIGKNAIQTRAFWVYGENIGEMGTGKTFIATAAAHLAGFQRILVLVPPHLTRKWQREVEATIPDARAAIVTSITPWSGCGTPAVAGPLFAILSRERAKLSYRWQPAVSSALGHGRRAAAAG